MAGWRKLAIDVWETGYNNAAQRFGIDATSPSNNSGSLLDFGLASGRCRRKASARRSRPIPKASSFTVGATTDDLLLLGVQCGGIELQNPRP